MEFIVNFFSAISKDNFGYALFANFLSALIVGSVFFMLKDWIFEYPNINGRYHLKIIVKETTYLPYKEMELHFVVHLSSANGNLIGGGERIYEDSSYGKNAPHIIHYSGDSKIPIQIHGNIAKKIFARDVINIFCKVESKARMSNMALTIEIPFFYEKRKIVKFDGEFTWSVAGKSGLAFLSKKSFKQKNPTKTTNELNDEKYSIYKNSAKYSRKTNYIRVLSAEYTSINISETNITG